jgi:hypothetical protein
MTEEAFNITQILQGLAEGLQWIKMYLKMT